ncbi:MAG TPA: serpin family protein [Polyangiaceae bacterium]|nr:serpin family protein [Polyangiaceae bacterium]
MLDAGDIQAACALYDGLRLRAGNICISPLSVRMAFGLCYSGARDRTADELREVFRFPGPRETIDRFATLLHAFASRDARLAALANAPWDDTAADPTLRIASRLWAAAGHPLLEDFAQTARDAFGAPVEQLNFAGDPEGSRATINGSIEKFTHGKIVELIAQGQLDTATKLVVTVAAYLRARWEVTFRKELTRNAPFFSPRGAVEVPLMEHVAHHPYGELRDIRVLDLDYEQGDVAMRIAVGREEGALARSEAVASELLALPLRDARIRLFLPRFRCESSLTLENVLSPMGLKAIFRYGDADLSGMDGTRDLYVSAAVHQAYVDVDELGTEAAAATALMGRAGASLRRPEDPIEVRVDRPFLFWILDRPTGTVLFEGRVVAP